MGRKKNTKIILITIILLIILILVAGIAYAYLSTDLFKGDKQLFFKYISQIGDEKKGFIEPNLEQYFETQATKPYKNDGSLSFNITTSGGEEEQYENVNNMELTFSRTSRFSKISKRAKP